MAQKNMAQSTSFGAIHPTYGPQRWRPYSPWCTATVAKPLQVYDYSWSDLQSLSWPSGAPLLTVSQALGLTAHLVQLLIIDLKTTEDVGRVRGRGQGAAHITIGIAEYIDPHWGHLADIRGCWQGEAVVEKGQGPGPANSIIEDKTCIRMQHIQQKMPTRDL